MIRGLYTGASAMLVYARRQDLLANDLANAQTPGYRTEDAPIRAFPELFIHEELAATRSPRGMAGTGAYLDRSYLRWEPAPIRYTGRELDLAIEGDGFFAVQTPAGVRLTRAGNFVVDAQGRLATPDGYVVLGPEGPVQAGTAQGAALAVTEQGEVLDATTGALLGRIGLVDVPDRQGLVREGSNLFRPTAESGPVAAAAGTIRQGMLEGSATSVVETMVQMIAGLRAYQAAQQAVRAEDEMTGSLIAQVGRVS
ncbi:MAG: flagellar hook-basal body protein [Limnochordaceae bacterium]|nr:flagellar hook-basal body protein [Limnochordaceae bacterium]